MSLCLADGGTLPFAACSFDRVLAQESVCHISDRGTFVTECHRVLRPGGVLVVVDYVLADRLPATAADLIEAWTRGWAIAEPWTAGRWAQVRHGRVPGLGGG